MEAITIPLPQAEGPLSQLDLTGPITILAGPPGSGKTRLLRSIYQRLQQPIAGPDLGYVGYIPAIKVNLHYRSAGPSVSHSSILSKAAESHHQADLPNRPDAFELLTDSLVVQNLVDQDYRAYRTQTPGFQLALDQADRIASETMGFPISYHDMVEDENGYFPRFKTPYRIQPLDQAGQSLFDLLMTLTHFLQGLSRRHNNERGGAQDAPSILLLDEPTATLPTEAAQRFLPALRRHLPNTTLIAAIRRPQDYEGAPAFQVIHLPATAKQE